MKQIMIIIACFALLLIIANISQVSATPPLQLIKEANESTVAINYAQTTLLEAETLLLQAKQMDLKGYSIWDKIFIKYRVISKCENEIKKARKSMKNAITAHEKDDFFSVSLNTRETISRASYASFELNNVLAGKKIKDWTRMDIVQEDSNWTPTK